MPTPEELRLEQLKRIQDEIKAAQEAYATMNAAEYAAQEDKIKKLEKQAAIMDSLISARGKSLAALKKEIEDYNGYLSTMSSGFLKQEVERKKQAAEDEQRKIRIDGYLSRAHELNSAEEEHLQKLIKQNNEAEKRNIYLEDAVTLAGDISSVFGAYGKHSFFNVKKMRDIAASLKGVSKNLGEFGKKLAIGILTNIIDGMINLAFKMSEVEASLRKTTGANESFIKSMRESYDQARDNNVSMEDFYGTVTELRTSFIDFTKIGVIAQKNIAEITSTMVQAGHNAGALSGALNMMTISMGQTGEQAASTLLELDAFARDIGVPPAQLTEQFNAMGSSLAKLGVNGVDAFKDLARVSKITGLEMQKILNLTNKFDTFEGAAEQAGKLNAAIGGNFVNAMDLMTATDPVERFEMMRNSLETAGLEFDNMSYYQRKFFAESMGLEDVSDLAAMMRGDMGELGAEIGKTGAQYEDMAERARLASSFQDRLNLIMQRLIPIVEPLIDAFDVLITSMEKGSNATKKYSKFSLSLGGAFTTLVKVGKRLIELFAFLIDNWALGLLAVVAVAGGVFLLSQALNSGTPGLWSFAAAFAAVGLAAAGISTTISEFTKLMDSISVDKVTAFYGLMLGMGGGALTFTMGAAGLKSLSWGMSSFFKTLEEMPEKKVKDLASFMKTLVEINKADFKSLDIMTEKLKAIKTVLEDMPDNTMIAITTMTKAMASPTAQAAAQAAASGASQRSKNGNSGKNGKPVVNIPIQVFLDGKEIGYHLKNISTEQDTKNTYFDLSSIGY